jgi:hypothetical protein
VNGTRYYYRLEDWDTASVSTYHGPVSASQSPCRLHPAETAMAVGVETARNAEGLVSLPVPRGCSLPLRTPSLPVARGTGTPTRPPSRSSPATPLRRPSSCTRAGSGLFGAPRARCKSSCRAWSSLPTRARPRCRFAVRWSTRSSAGRWSSSRRRLSTCRSFAASDRPRSVSRRWRWGRTAPCARRDAPSALPCSPAAISRGTWLGSRGRSSRGIGRAPWWRSRRCGSPARGRASSWP